MVLANLAQRNDIDNYIKHYMVSNRQDDSGRKGSMKILQNLALLMYLLMIAYISRRKKTKLFSSYWFISITWQ